MDLKDVQDIILAGSNRRDIIKVNHHHKLLELIPSDLIERHVCDINSLAKSSAETMNLKLDALQEIQRQHEQLRNLILKAREKMSETQQKKNKQLETAKRLIKKTNFMRQLTLVLVANVDINNTEYSLAISREMIEQKNLSNYRLPQEKST